MTSKSKSIVIGYSQSRDRHLAVLYDNTRFSSISDTVPRLDLEGSESQRFSEHVMDAISFDKQPIELQKVYTSKALPAMDITAHSNEMRQLNHVHANKSAEIRGKWIVPPMSDKEASEFAADLLLEDDGFTNLINGKLEKIGVDIRL